MGREEDKLVIAAAGISPMGTGVTWSNCGKWAG